MNYRNRFRIFFLTAWLLAFWAAHGGAESLSPAEYGQQLDKIASDLHFLESQPEHAGAVVAAMPDSVSVRNGAAAVNVNYKPLKDELAEFARAESKNRPALLGRMEAYIQALRAGAQAYERPRVDMSTAQAQLKVILDRPEFSKVQGPNTKEALLARIYRWLSRLLRKMAFSRSSHFDLVRILIYVLVAAAVLLLLLWTIRRFRRPQKELPGREIILFTPSARSWRTWLADARALAAQQDWRNAVHLAYWAGISYLEEHGAWKPNRARTPREYLRLIGTRASQYPALAALTRKLEVIWYGYGIAAEADFQEAIGQLEKLGCR
jgi:hypothetical protein